MVRLVRKDYSQLERLDLAARARATEASIPRTIVVFAIFAVICTVLSAGSTASQNETGAVELFSVSLYLTLIALWLRWKYAFHMIALLFIAVAVGGMFFRGYNPHTAFGWIVYLSYPLIFAAPIYQFWKNGVTFRAVRGKDWQTERAQVSDWLAAIQRSSRPTILEFSTGSFWTGYSTYRVLNIDYGWAIARFKTSKLQTLYDFRIRDDRADVQNSKLNPALAAPDKN